MSRSLKVGLSIVLLTAVFVAGYWLRQPGPSSGAAVRKPLYWHDPMHPSYRSDKPGIAPDCGMQLEPVYAEDLAAGGSSSSPLSPGAVRISVEKQQIMGLRTAPAVMASGAHTVRLLGKVAADETRVYRVEALAEGVVRYVSSYATGNMVEKNALLARYFVPLREVYNAMQGLLVALSTLDQQVSQGLSPTLIDAAKAEVRLEEELLQTYGLTERQIQDLGRTRQITRDIEFRAPVTGLILSRNVFLGQRLERGAEIYRIADISRVWVLADVFENESGLVKPGAVVRVRYHGRLYRATIADARLFDTNTRTLKVRLELDNPGLVLLPDMFVDVEFEVHEPEGISVPYDAVLDSGRRKVVFVSAGQDVFEPREVTTGTRYGDRVQIVQGLQPGDNVVVSGLFLLDSESRLRLAAANAAKAAETKTAVAAGAVTDPVCGMSVDPAKTAHSSSYNGATYYFCSTSCKSRFDKDPASFAAKKAGKL